MSSKSDLVVDFCSYQAAKYAVMHWHYSRAMPSTYTRLVMVGVWEDARFVGSVIFSHGSNRNIGTPYGLTIFEAVELVRVALTKHANPVSRIVILAIKKLMTCSPGLRLLVSYADPMKGHIGMIYQAMNWVYVGETPPSSRYVIHGKMWHKKAAWATFGTNKTDLLGAEVLIDKGKYKYLYPLDRAMRRQIEPLRQPYPKRDMRPVKGDNPATSEAGRFDSDPDALDLDTGDDNG